MPYGRKDGNFRCGLTDKVIVMSRLARNNRFLGSGLTSNPPANPYIDDLIQMNDLLIEQILDNMNSTPRPGVKADAVMPEVRKQKVLKVRRQLTEANTTLANG